MAPRVCDSLIDHSLDFSGGNFFHLFRTAVEECLKPLGNACPVFTMGSNLSRRCGGNANFFVRGNRPTEELFHDGPHGLREFTSFSD